MGSYSIRTKNGIRIIDEGEFYGPERAVIRKDILTSQTLRASDGTIVPIIRCMCKSDGIPMILTSHSIPHLRTAAGHLPSEHNRFCRHRTPSPGKLLYRPAIEYDEERGRNFLVSGIFGRPAQKKCMNKEYIAEYAVRSNAGIRITEGTMTWSGFIRHCICEYFPIHWNSLLKQGFEWQSREYFLNKIYGYILNQRVNGKILSDALREREEKLLIREITGIEETGRIVRLNVASPGSAITLPAKIWENTADRLNQTYSKIRPDTVLARNDCHLILVALTSKKEYQRADGSTGTGQNYANTCLILVNNYGLYTESFNEAAVCNIICDWLKSGAAAEYYFEKPLYPSGEYLNENLISDGIIRKRRSEDAVCLEIFERNEPEYLKMKEEKKKTCTKRLIYWDVTDAGKDGLGVFENELKKLR